MRPIFTFGFRCWMISGTSCQGDSNSFGILWRHGHFGVVYYVFIVNTSPKATSELTGGQVGAYSLLRYSALPFGSGSSERSNRTFHHTSFCATYCASSECTLESSSVSEK